jgi:hypothetical protein
MTEERIPPTNQDEDWQRGYKSGLEAPGDIPRMLPGGLSGFNTGFIAGMKAARKQPEFGRPHSDRSTQGKSASEW